MHHGVGGVGQSRARGLTRAILDTFPIVKFASANNTVPAKDPEEDPPPVSDTSQNQSAAAAVELSDLEGQLTVNGGENNERVELPVTTMVEDVGENEGQNDRGRGSRGDFDGNEGGWPKLGAGEAVSRSGGDIGEGPSCPLPPPPRKDVVPDAIGRETCPICIVDFAEGDDLRLLPCEGKHRFHQECVDPWLLELSSSCPICRQGKYSRFVCLICLRIHPAVAVIFRFSGARDDVVGRVGGWRALAATGYPPDEWSPFARQSLFAIFEICQTAKSGTGRKRHDGPSFARSGCLMLVLFSSDLFGFCANFLVIPFPLY